jgi:hypothetical protein
MRGPRAGSPRGVLDPSALSAKRREKKPRPSILRGDSSTLVS